jgi:hypothetical protein
MHATDAGMPVPVPYVPAAQATQPEEACMPDTVE